MRRLPTESDQATALATASVIAFAIWVFVLVSVAMGTVAFWHAVL